MKRFVVVLCAQLLLVPAAGAVTFGANLRRHADARFDCTVQPVPDAFGNPVLLPTGATSCTWFTVGRNYATGVEGTIVPVGNGRITRVRVRVGAVTGRMRVVVLNALRNTADTICCKQVARTRIFRPRRNAVTTLRVNFAVHNTFVIDPRTGFASYELLAISVLDPGVPIPADDTGNYGDLTGPLSFAMFPALGQGEERAGGTGTVGYVVLLNATWTKRR